MVIGVEWALHSCVVLSQASGPVPTRRLAEFHGLSRSYLAKHLQALATAGLIRSIEGHAGGYELSRDPSTITVMQIVDAIEQTPFSVQCSVANRVNTTATDDTGERWPCSVATVLAQAEAAWREALTLVTLADIASLIELDSRGLAMRDIRNWLSTDET